MNVLRSTKAFVLKAANSSGISTVVANTSWRRQRLLILCYHGVSQHDEHEWSDLYVSQDHLSMRLRMLQSMNATVLPLDEALVRLYDGTLPRTAVAITFDDGARDFHSRAVPVLTNAAAHSTLYLATYYCHKAMPVFDPMVSYLLWKARGRLVNLPGFEGPVLIPESTRETAFSPIHLKLLKHAKSAGMDAEAKNEFARELAIICNVDFDELNERRLFHLMNESEVRSLDPELIDVQLHTHRHLTPESLAQTHDELTRNAAEIDALTGHTKPRTHFCYPSGRYNSKLAGWLAHEGLQSATTCEPGIASRMSPKMEIPRFIDTMGASEDHFRAWVTGTAEFTQMIRRGTRNNATYAW